MRRGLSRRAMSAAFGLLFWPGVMYPASAQQGCDAPEPVCDARAAVFGISAFDPVGSAVRIGPDLLVANRHSVADQTSIEIYPAPGKKLDGEVVPTSFPGDMVLIRAKLPDGPFLKLGDDASGSLWGIGWDVSGKQVKVFPKGKRLLPPAEGKPYARLHHTAYTQPGASGGALVNTRGELVGIISSGGQGRFEAVPSSQIETLKSSSGTEQAEKSRQIGKDVRECTLMLEKGDRIGKELPEKFAQVLETSCTANTNRQLYDLAGQMFGRHKKLDLAIAFFERSLEKDPNAINTRVSLVIALRFARRLDEAKEHVKWLLDVIPEERSIHPIALAVGKTSNDQELIDKALALIEKHAPHQLEAAKKYLSSPVNR